MIQQQPPASSDRDEPAVDQLAPLLEQFHQQLLACDSGVSQASEALAAAELERLSRLQECVVQLEQLRAALESGADDTDGDNSTTPVDRGAADTDEPPVAPDQELPGEGHERLGRFLIEGRLGGGGQGIVFLAFDPVLKRRVALKIPRPETLLAAAQRSRFLREAQAVAQFSHQNLATVFEVGEEGPLCFIASAYCEGPNLAEWLANQRQPVNARQAAGLVAVIADAVEYLHRGQVLHRDLKPANILLEPRPDADGSSLAGYTPKVTDFGLIKLVGGEQTQTRDGTLMGTPAYMAPEQAKGEQAAIGPATDVYGLGVILYELLTGERPFAAAGEAECLQRVIEDEPKRPRRRRADLPLDLEAICLKCLEKDPRRRYSTASDLAADLRRFLSELATLARPLTTPQRLTRWARRKPAVAALVTATLLFLTSIATISTFAWARASQQEQAVRRALARADRDAQAARVAKKNTIAALAEARQQARNAEEVVRLLKELFQTADPLGLASLGLRDGHEVGQDLTLSELLSRSEEHARQTVQNQPLVLATLLDTLGNVYCNLGQPAPAGPLIREAFELRRRSGGSDREMAASRLSLGNLLRWEGEIAQSEQLLRQASAENERLHGPESLELADALLSLAITLWQSSLPAGNPAAVAVEVDNLAERNYAIRRARLGEEHRDVALAKVVYAMSRFGLGDNATAMRLVTEATATQAGLPGGQGLLTAFTDYAQAKSSSSLSDMPGAIAVYRRVREKFAELCGERHLLTQAIGLELAGALRDMGQTGEAFGLTRTAIQSAEANGIADSPLLISVLCEAADVAAGIGEFAEAERYLKHIARSNERVHGNGKQRLDALKLAALYLAAGRYDESVALFRQHHVPMIENAGEAVVPDIETGKASYEELGASVWCESQFALCRGDAREAIRLTHLCLTYCDGRLGRELHNKNSRMLAHAVFIDNRDNGYYLEDGAPPNVIVVEKDPESNWKFVLRARRRLHQGRIAEARQWIEAVLVVLERAALGESWCMGDARCVLGLVFAAEGNNAEAKAHLRAGLDILRKTRGERYWLTRDMADELHNFYLRTDQAQAATALKTVIDSVEPIPDWRSTADARGRE